jgi:tetratricopeptide (TPR) repeat protein
MHDDAEQPTQPEPQGAAALPPEPSEATKKEARKWFAHAKKAAETRNYDYAIELYVNGLAVWPNAVEEGLKALRVAGTARRLAGGKGAGFLAARKRPVGGKDVLKSLNNALYLFGMDPVNITHMEQILQLAAKARCVGIAQWISLILMDAYNSAKKLSDSRYAVACSAMGEAADIATQARMDQAAMTILQANIATSQIWVNYHPNSSAAAKAYGDATSKMTIVKGHFAHADGFAESLKDAELQHDLHDRDKAVHSEDRTQELITRARQDWEKNRSIPAKLIQLADLMLRTQTDKVENEAIALLEKEYATSQDYIFKQKADEVLMRQLNRHRRELVAKIKAEPGNQALRRDLAHHSARQIEAEIKIYEDRQRQYPSDMRIRFMLATRLFAAKRYDDAIPLFQQAQADARCRNDSRLYIGRCFYEKKFHDQAVGSLRKAAEELESKDNPQAMEMSYWLARSLEASGKAPEAKEIYGQLIQLDYNYLDARQRLEKLAEANGG